MCSRYGEDIRTFVPTHEVSLLTNGRVLTSDYVQIRGAPDERGILYAFTPLQEEPSYAILPGGKWQSLLPGSTPELRVRPVKMDSRPKRGIRCGVYFIQSQEGPEIKIGWSEDIHRRIQDFQTAHASVIRLKAWIPSEDASLEKKLHHECRGYHVRGEWFALPENYISMLLVSGYDVRTP